MKNFKITSAYMILFFAGLTVLSCKDEPKDTPNTSEATQNSQETTPIAVTSEKSEVKNPASEQILADYMALKNALVDTDEKAAAAAGEQLENTLKSFKVENYTDEQQSKIKDLVASATSHANQIATSDMEQQRAQFQKLNDDITAMVSITGTENTLYQQFCPMYGEGGAWLSTEKNIRNPYFGSKMMKCGEVQKEIR